MRARVEAARLLQSHRYEALGLPPGTTNARCPPDRLEQAAAPDSAGLALLRDAAERMRLSARAYHRVLKVARTIADLAGSDTIGRAHLAEALSYRSLPERLQAA